MATIRTPSTTGGSIAAFLDNYYRAQQNARLEDTLAQQTALAGLQATRTQQDIDAGERRAAGEGALTGAIAALPRVAQPPAGPMAAPGVNLIPDAQGDVGGAMDIPVGGPAPALLMPPASGAPMSQVTAGMSPAEQAALLTTPGGRAALQAYGVVPDAVFAESQRIRELRIEANRRGQAAHEAMRKGDVLGSYAERMAALRAAKDAAKPEQHAQYDAMLAKVESEYKAMLKDEKELEALSVDMRDITELEIAARNNPSQENLDALLRRFAASKSKRGQAHGHEVQKSLATDLLKTTTDPAVRVRLLQYAVLAKNDDASGTKVHTREDLVNALRVVKRERPTDWAQAYVALMKSGKLPAEWQLAERGEVENLNDYQVAHETAVAQGHAYGTKEYFVALNAALDVRKQAGRQPTAGLGANVTAELRAMGVDPEKAAPEDIRRAIEAHDKRRQGLPAGVNAELAAVGVDPRQATPDDVRAALERIEAKRKARKGGPLDDLPLGGGAAPKPAPAPAKPAAAPKPGRAATRAEAQEARKRAGGDKATYLKILRDQGIDPSLDLTP